MGQAALLPLSGEKGKESKEELLLIKASNIRRYEKQPRTFFDPTSLKALSDSIRVSGQKVPILVTRLPKDKSTGPHFIIIDGERRWRASRMIDENYRMTAVFQSIADEDELFKLSTTANLNREDMTHPDIARAIKRLIDRNKMTQPEIAKEYGKSIGYVQQHLSLLKLHPEVFAMMNPELPEEAQLPYLTARHLAKIPSHKAGQALQLQLAREVINEAMNSKEAVPYIEKMVGRAGYSLGGRRRNPSDDFKIFKAFVERTFIQSGRWAQADIETMYLGRFDEERESDQNVLSRTIVRLKGIVENLENIKGDIENKSK